ncbi:hypothetical protein DEIPH_ctg139orf0113 [Deinococcus phoenicis]|uniref:Uncharacterized protein n=1 Tax=Deinococcus phoenicis TaxID=1476583 RepID=A0A016QKG9_9DEIO|nr:hypothetical protein [Deinococcus phoenicis]EYB66387.1 hypothetical protein DEIPH_ctg139orf0113 [Deinococcus phoenicis]
MQLHGARYHLYQPPGSPPPAGYDHLIRAGVPLASPPLPDDHPSVWALREVLTPLLAPLDELDCACRVYEITRRTRSLAVGFVRHTQGMNIPHIDHLPALYEGLPEGMLGSVLYHLCEGAAGVYPVFTPQFALEYTFPEIDATTASGREKGLWQLAEEYGIEADDLSTLEAALAEEGTTTPTVMAEALAPYLTDAPLSLESLTRLAAGHPHLRRVVRALTALHEASRQVPTPEWDDWKAGEDGPFYSATVSGFAAALFVSAPGRSGERHVPCQVEHALDDLGDRGMNTEFAPHWAVYLGDPAAARRLLDYAAVAPRVQRAAQAVLRELARRSS